MTIPISVVMEDGMEITLYPWDGDGTMEGLHETIRYRIWRASTKYNDSGFGVTQEAALTSLLNKLHPVTA
jgi:hypothetical protein